MELLLLSGTKLDTFITIKNETSYPIDFRIFLDYNEFLRKHSLIGSANLSPESPELTFTRSIDIIKPQNFNSSPFGLGTLKIRSKIKHVNVDTSLPPAKFITSGDLYNSYIGIRINLTNHKTHFSFRTY